MLDTMKRLDLFFVVLCMCMPVCYFQFLKDYGDSCEHSDECYDAKMICVGDNPSELRCACDRFHAWNGSYSGCVQVVSLQQIMNETVLVHNTAEQVEAEQEFSFRGPMYSGYFMVTVILFTSFIVCVFCMYVRQKDRKLETESAQFPIKHSKRSHVVSFI